MRRQNAWQKKKDMKKVFVAIKNTFLAILKGELLLRMRLDKYFIHIAYTFLLVWLIILYSMMVQNTLAKVESNRSAVNDLKIFHAQKTVKLVSLGRLQTVEKLLKEQGSEITLPEKPANRLEE